MPLKAKGPDATTEEGTVHGKIKPNDTIKPSMKCSLQKCHPKIYHFLPKNCIPQINVYLSV